MLRQFYIVVCLIFISINTKAQSSLYMPRNILQAYENGTRSLDGRPGKNYWQNRGFYNITVTVTPPSRTVKELKLLPILIIAPIQLKTLSSNSF